VTQPVDPVITSSAIKARARALGFDLCGIAPADDFPELAFLPEWIARGYAGEMAYIPRSADRRADVRAVVPGARSVIVTGTLYNTVQPYDTEPDRNAAVISRYAWGDDYHDVIKLRLEALLAWMRTESAEPFDARAYVDTGPVQERVYAQYGGLGWIGKNTCLINPELGSWLFLGEIITTLSLEPDAAARLSGAVAVLAAAVLSATAAVSSGRGPVSVSILLLHDVQMANSRINAKHPRFVLMGSHLLRS
jgi:epoxyqueuosine reductase